MPSVRRNILGAGRGDAVNIETVTYEARDPEGVMYKRGTVKQTLYGFHAQQYRSMIWKYGEAEAAERLWWIWHKRKEA